MCFAFAKTGFTVYVSHKFLSLIILNHSCRRFTVKHSFYDVKSKKKIEVEVTDKVTYGKKDNERYAFKAKTCDGRNLTAFVSKATWDKASI